MIFKTRHIGSQGGRAAKIIEMKVETIGGSVECDVTDLKGRVDPGFIERLREIADELEHHNKLTEE